MLKHTVPIVENVPVATVLKLRQEDEGSFQLYRKRVIAVREQVGDPKTLREAAEQLKAEYSTLEAKITSRKKSMWAGLRDEVVIGTGTIGAGLATWLSGMLSPTWSAVVAAAGGLPAARKLVADALGARRPTQEDMQHPLYFL